MLNWNTYTKEIDIVKDWLKEKDFKNMDKAQTYIEKHNGTNVLLDKALQEYYHAYMFKNKDSFARKIGYDSRGHKYAIGQSGGRISTKKYARYFKKLQR